MGISNSAPSLRASKRIKSKQSSPYIYQDNIFQYKTKHRHWQAEARQYCLVNNGSSYSRV